MKDWQNGYEINYLKNLCDYYKPYNLYSLSPFSEMKKNDVAVYLKDNKLKIIKEKENIKCLYAISDTKVKSNITAYNTNDLIIGTKEKGDVVITKIVGDKDVFKNELLKIKSPVWIYVWAEDKEWNEFFINNDYKYVYGKTTTFGEIYSIYFKDSIDSFIPRKFNSISNLEKLNIFKIKDLDKSIVNSINLKLQNLNLNFINHYSNYNVGKSWSAISLRGYTSDPNFITKPSEMNDKWKKQNKDVDFVLQDTPLRKLFPEVDELLSDFNTEIHRIRFMKLSSGKGELDRHTDQVDSDMGTTIGKLIRIHFPIITNDKVIFTSWNYNGQKTEINMREGECWYLDIRKPHKAINKGDTDRIHLVVDIEINNEIIKLYENTK